MPRVKITNLRPGPIVINSLKITINGRGSVYRDASIVGDPDLSELEANGLVSIEQAEDPNKPAPQVSQAPTQPAAPKQGAAKQGAAKQVAAKQGAAKQGAAKQGDPEQAVKQNMPPRQKPGTDFRNVDPDDHYKIILRKDGTEELRPQEEQTEGQVVVVTDTGPQVRTVGPGINGRPGPKFVGDAGVVDPNTDDDVEIPLSDSEARTI